MKRLQSFILFFIIISATHASTIKIPDELIKRNIKKTDPSIMVSATTVNYMIKKKQKVYLVDVRTKKEFAKVHIPGSINIQLHAVKTKTYLKSGTVILVSKGLDTYRIQTEIDRLKKMKYKVRILKNGIFGWYHSKNQIEGDLIELTGYNKMNPVDYFLSKDSDNLWVVDISKTKSQDSKFIFPYADHIPALTTSKKWVSTITSKRKKNKTLVIFNEDGIGYESVEKALLNDRVVNVYFLKGGVVAYKKYLHNLALAQKPRPDRIKTVGDCNQCTKKMEE